MKLPKDHNVSVATLLSVFRNTTATYKFYWFLAIIEAVEEGKNHISKKELFARMIANAWYTVNYFHVSFGASDKIQNAINQIKTIETIEVDAKKSLVLDCLLQSKDVRVQKQLKHFDLNVPHKFLSPWLESPEKRIIYQLSQENYKNPPYALYKDSILVQPAWFDYFKRNSGLLKDFCLWNLTLFLQVRNPNVPDIPSKLLRPEKRVSLARHKTDFWDLVITELGPLNCIYTGKKMGIGDYAVEHFIPFQFVAHNLMWNLIPADPNFNSHKNDKLPQLDRYFDDFYKIQKEGVNVVKHKQPKCKFLDEYVYLFHDLNFTKEKYRQVIEPLLTIAHNNGFQYMRK